MDRINKLQKTEWPTKYKAATFPQMRGNSPFGVFVGEIPLSENYSPKYSPFQYFFKKMYFFYFSLSMVFFYFKTQAGR